MSTGRGVDPRLACCWESLFMPVAESGDRGERVGTYRQLIQEIVWQIVAKGD